MPEMQMSKEESRRLLAYSNTYGIAGAFTGFVLWLLVLWVGFGSVVSFLIFVGLGYVIGFLKALGDGNEEILKSKLADRK